MTEDLLATLERIDSPSAGQLDRIERLISTRDELEIYTDSLLSDDLGELPEALVARA